jgi:hypothetical protein
VRRYPASRWVCTRIDNSDPANDPLNNWRRLFNNDPQAAIASTFFQESPPQKMLRKLQTYLFGLNSASADINQVYVQSTSKTFH